MAPQEVVDSTHVLLPFLQGDLALPHGPRGRELAEVPDLDQVGGFLSQAQQTKLKG